MSDTDNAVFGEQTHIKGTIRGDQSRLGPDRLIGVVAVATKGDDQVELVGTVKINGDLLRFVTAADHSGRERREGSIGCRRLRCP